MAAVCMQMEPGADRVYSRKSGPVLAQSMLRSSVHCKAAGVVNNEMKKFMKKMNFYTIDILSSAFTTPQV
jgi:hypothetical protein